MGDDAVDEHIRFLAGQRAGEVPDDLRVGVQGRERHPVRVAPAAQEQAVGLDRRDAGHRGMMPELLGILGS